MNYFIFQDRVRKRLEALSKFQYAMLCHALSFPKVKKVVYSTCSVHQQVINVFTLISFIQKDSFFSKTDDFRPSIPGESAKCPHFKKFMAPRVLHRFELFKFQF